MMTIRSGLFEDHEVEAMIEALTKGEGRLPTEEEAKQFFEWATLMRVRNMLIDGAIQGTYIASLEPDGNYRFRVDPAVRTRIAVNEEFGFPPFADFSDGSATGPR